MKLSDIAVQLWSVKDTMETDFEGTIKKIAEMGFGGVEFAGFFGHSAKQVKSVLDSCGLKAVSAHVGYDEIVGHPDETIAFHKIIGNKNIVCPHYELKDMDSLEAFAAGIESVAGKYEAAGMTLGYHNHAHEFAKNGGEYLLDKLFERLSFIMPQIDTYWVFNAGVDISSYCLKYKGRCRFLHLKDGTKDKSAPIGYGDVDIKAVLKTAGQLNAQLILEDETWDPNGLECVEKGAENLRRM